MSVQDGAARLPNGEGTRSQICELLKDSQFLAPGVTDAQVCLIILMNALFILLYDYNKKCSQQINQINFFSK